MPKLVEGTHGQKDLEQIGPPAVLEGETTVMALALATSSTRCQTHSEIW